MTQKLKAALLCFRMFLLVHLGKIKRDNSAQLFSEETCVQTVSVKIYSIGYAIITSGETAFSYNRLCVLFSP